MRKASSVPLGLFLATCSVTILTACGGTGSDPIPVIASFTVSPAITVLGTTATLSWSVSDATSLSIDQGVGTVTGTSKPVTPAATTTYTLTATGPGGSATGMATLTVTTPPSVLELACSGASCGAVSSTVYSGTGIGIWRYRNTTGVAQTIDIHIGGVSAGKHAALVFSNGTGGGMATLPSAGTLAFPSASPLHLEPPMTVDPADLARERWHQGMLEENRQVGLSLRAARGAGPVPARTALASPALPTPVVGDARTWNDAFAEPVAVYDTVARDVCDRPGGRKAVFWVDPRSTASASLTTEDLAYFKTTFCGAAGATADGGFGRVKALMGDVWGVVDPSLTSAVISDAPALQDVNVVFLEVPPGTAPKIWAGYFWGGNNLRKSYSPQVASSNEALAFFIDATQVHMSASSRGYLGSSLLHELTHMANFFQRNISRGTPNDTWLEETTATMTDDIVAPVATPDHYSLIPGQRILPYVRSGGAISYVGWDYPAQNTYALAGAFGAFVNRRYGTSILSGTVGCLGTGIDCLDSLIVAGGGTSFAEEFARVGASIFGLLPLTGTPDGYGYPAKISGSYTLAAIDVAAFAASRRATATPLGLEFSAGSHTYQLDTVAAGRAVYTRTGVVVPTGTSIMLVIQ
jgi:hypothetical protein